MKLIQESKETGRMLVTKSGHPVTIYNENARDTNAPAAIHGSIAYATFDKIQSWGLDGKASSKMRTEDLTLYSVVDHFDWNQLPCWCNAYLYKTAGVWYCTSLHPVKGETSGEWIPPRTALVLAIPESVSKDIHLHEYKNEVYKNPAYE